MRSDAPALMPIFRSRHQANLLTWLLLHPDQEYTLTSLAQRLDVPLTTLHREAQRLVNAEVLRDRTVGRTRLLRANPDHLAAAALTRLLELTFGPHTVIEDEFADLPNVDRIIIYGSWAARYQGTRGAPPADVDVLVIGNPNRADVYDAADRAQDRLGMQVNPVLRTPQQWAAVADPLVQQIQSSPTLTVPLHASAPFSWYSCGMKGTIDKAGRVVIPKPLRDQIGLRPGQVELIPDGSGVRIEPLAQDEVVEVNGRLVIPPAGAPIDDDLVRALRDADQR